MILQFSLTVHLTPEANTGNDRGLIFDAKMEVIFDNFNADCTQHPELDDK
jgi:hypothetical protein